MDKELKKFLQDFQKYRWMQNKLVALRSKPESAKNVPLVTQQMFKINDHLLAMDRTAAALLIQMKEVTA